jgi:hypothetical protein
MMHRRIPIADVELAIAHFKAKAGADADVKLLRAFAARFQDLSQQRSRILDGLERFGRKDRRIVTIVAQQNRFAQSFSRERRVLTKRWGK